MDALHITDIRAYGYTGALPEENVLGQWFRVDLVLWMDLAPAGASDQLADTHNYATATLAIQELIRTTPFRLIEALASEIAKTVLRLDDRLTQVQVKLTKLTPPIPDFTGQVTVEIKRDRTCLDHPSPPPIADQQGHF
ncbi:MAG: dihydroneopterin aldolase [Leptolyngbya sp. RL_3_1]|nr:dihydroneopterin aldolase [Leptolyngbya sp. RL_3_1]